MKPNPDSQTLWCCLVIVALTFAAFHGALENDFVNWDDPLFICENPRIQTLDWPHIRELFASFEVGAYTPLSQLSLAMDYAVWKNDPAGFHLTAILLHCCNACLVFFLSRRLIRQVFSPTPSSFGHNGALIAALLFSLHPLRVESVAWACERRDVLSGFWGLACALAYTRYAGPQSSFPWFLGAFFLFVCALLSKAVVIALPLVFFLLDIHPFRRFSLSNIQSWRSNIKVLGEKAPFLLVSLLVGMATVQAVLWSDLAHDSQRVGWEPRIAQSLVANTSYLLKLFVPIHLNPLDPFRGLYHFKQPIVWAGLAVNGGITLLLILLRRRFPSALIAWLSYCVIIAPFLGLAQSGLQLTADRYTYLSTIPLCILAGSTVSKVQSSKFKVQSLAFSFFILLWLGYRTHQQTQVWQNSETLWAYSLKLDSRNLTARLNLCDALETQGDLERCISSYEEALRLAPRNAEVWNHLGIALEKMQRHQEAVNAYEQALKNNPSHVGAHNNLGMTLLNIEKVAPALEHFKAAQKLARLPEIEFNMATCFELQGNAAAAIQHYKEAARRGFADAWIPWSKLADQQGNRSQALEILKEGAKTTRQSRVQLACAERILLQQNPSRADLSLARELLVELDCKTEGRNQKIHSLKIKCETRF
ncbi:MAG: tetratricopeptide repeat protein [Verrucomicrobia bacterium]|nr:tetratricopeptide repeat protein [Verrucomicrobiota bacterium]